MANSIERAISLSVPFCGTSSDVRRSLSKNFARFRFRGGASVNIKALASDSQK
jgi:hypothetical protein